MARGGNRLSDDEFRRLCDEAKARVDLSSIVERHTKLKKSGRELSGLCPFHPEKSPSFYVSDAKGQYHCYGCGRSGDHFHILRYKEGLSFQQAYEALTNDTFPTVDPALKAQRAAEDVALYAVAVERARAVWAITEDPERTPAGVYMHEVRGITAPLPPSIRFAMTPAWYDDETGECGPDLPAVVGAVTDLSDAVIGVQRIFLRDGGCAKANMKKPKLSLGRPKGGALRLDHHIARDVYDGDGLIPPGDPRRTIIITEGPEDGLSLMQELPDQRVWVALGTAMMPAIAYPPEVRRIVIAGQNDAAGRAAVERARVALVERDFEVGTMWPGPAFKDWNDQLRGVRR